MRRFFDPRRWRIILFDQRGAGRSTPHASLKANTTPHLIADIERLREHLGVEAWAVFGGSWGSTLALAYAEACPERALGLVLRGVFLSTRAEIDWFYRGGAAALMPDAWERFLAPLSPGRRADPVAAYLALLRPDDEDMRAPYARAWSDWESAAVNHTLSRRRGLARRPDPRSADALARIECWYMAHEGFLDGPDALIDGVGRIAHLPCSIVQGRLDLVTPPAAAWRLARTWRGAELSIVDGAGHAAVEPGLANGLIRATDALAGKLGG
jgi:proline iminopeptidase